jgi:hypothetical protein
MTAATSFGCESIATWLGATTFVDASICFAMLFSCSGQIHVVASGYHGDA